MASRTLGDFEINEISGEARMPIPGLPILQSFIRGGVLDLVFLGDVSELNQDWSHGHIFGGVGIGLSGRVSKEFELGLDLSGAYSQSIFDKLVLDGEQVSRAQGNIVGAADLRIALNPSYNLSMAIRPSLRYTVALGSVEDYNGFSFGIGVGANYRFGTDPDAPTAEIRAIQFADTTLPDVFAAMQSYYADNPFGTVILTNTESFEVQNVDVSFFQAGYMDSPTHLLRVEELGGGQSLEVPVTATFNDQVFTTQGIKPLTGEIIVTYSARNRPTSQSQPVTYDLHDRNSVTWTDDNKAGAFITSADGAIRNYSSFIRQASRDITNPYISENLQFAMQAYAALTELGILYQIDPTSPFAQVQEDTVVVDSISLPRETLTRLTGDCDDLTVLYNTMLETVGIHTGFVTTPGHIYSAFDTGVRPADHDFVHPNREMMIEVGGSLWVLVEVTLMGRAGFLEAWSTGISEYRRYDDNPQARGFYITADAQTVYLSVGLRETDLGLQYGSPEAIQSAFGSQMNTLAELILEPHLAAAEEQDSARGWNAYGIAAARTGFYDTAEQAFMQTLEMDSGNLNAQLNLGSLYYLGEDFASALEVFRAAEATIQVGTSVRPRNELNGYLNLSKTHYALEEYAEAQEYYSRAEQVDPDTAEQFAYLGGSDTGRASDAAGEEPIFFFGEE